MSAGGLSTVYSQKIAEVRNSFVPITVRVSREATLTEDMKSVESRYLHGILLVRREGYSDAVTWELNREEVVQLRDALTAALLATEDDVPLSDKYKGDGE